MKVLCKATGVARSSLETVSGAGPETEAPDPGQLDDGELARAIKEVLAQSPFSGEGYRKV